MADRPDATSLGSVLLLVPAAVFLLVVLGGISFDFAHAQLAQRELATLAESVANDAATSAIDQGVLRSEGRVVFDQMRADNLASLAIESARGDLDVTLLKAALDESTGSVVVVGDAEVSPIFLRALPGQAVPRHVHAVARAVVTK